MYVEVGRKRKADMKPLVAGAAGAILATTAIVLSDEDNRKLVGKQVTKLSKQAHQSVKQLQKKLEQLREDASSEVDRKTQQARTKLKAVNKDNDVV